MTETMWVEYHSPAWRDLVEQGWVTSYVVGSAARMIRQWI
jgi:hypothetical protein